MPIFEKFSIRSEPYAIKFKFKVLTMIAKAVDEIDNGKSQKVSITQWWICSNLLVRIMCRGKVKLFRHLEFRKNVNFHGDILCLFRKIIRNAGHQSIEIEKLQETFVIIGIGRTENFQDTLEEKCVTFLKHVSKKIKIIYWTGEWIMFFQIIETFPANQSNRFLCRG